MENASDELFEPALSKVLVNNQPSGAALHSCNVGSPDR